MCHHQGPIWLTGHRQVSPKCVCHLRRKNISITTFRFNVLFHHDRSTVISRRRNDRVVNVRMLPYGNFIDDTFDVFLKTNPRWWHSCQVHILYRVKFHIIQPRLSRSILQRNLSTLVIRDHWLYIRQTKFSNWRCKSSETSQHSPRFLKIVWNRGVFWRSLIGFTLPIPLNAMVVSHLVNPWSGRRAAQCTGV